MNSAKQSRSHRSKKDLHERTANFYNEKHWIGMDTAPAYFTETPPLPHAKENNKEHKYAYKPQEAKPVRPFQVSVGQQAYSGKKTPVELMQDILRVAQDSQPNRLYYSKQAEQNLSELLTNKFKLNSYVKKLQSDMIGLDASVVKNYQILALLLQQLTSADIEVKQTEGGMELKFNRGLTERQANEIQRLEKEREEKDKQIKYVIEEYEAIIFNFNDVIEKLVNKEEGRQKTKY